MLPDADVFGLLVGIPYDSMFGHRGLTHSLLFAAAVGGLAAWAGDGSVPARSRYSCTFSS